jgi:atlastin
LANFLHHLKPDIGAYSSGGGFDWSYGSKSHTKGIWMWNEPLKLNTPDHKDVCIVLMDTQGSFDNASTHKECATVFSISAFLSSIQIYNVKSNVEKTDLEHLNLFSQYRKITEKMFKQRFQFEELTILVRDWQFPDEYYYGFIGGEKFLDDRLRVIFFSKN